MHQRDRWEYLKCERTCGAENKFISHVAGMFQKEKKSYMKVLYFESFCSKNKKALENVMPVFQYAKHMLGELFNLKIVF